MTPAFTADRDQVFWGSVALSPQSIEDLFDIFIREGCITAFNELHDAHVAAGGIERPSGLRAA